DAGAELAVGLRAAALLDPGVLVRRNALRGELPADPVVLLGEDHLEPVAGRRQGARDPADTAADDDCVGLQLAFDLSFAAEGGQQVRERTDRGKGQERAAVHGGTPSSLPIV